MPVVGNRWVLVVGVGALEVPQSLGIETMGDGDALVDRPGAKSRDGRQPGSGIQGDSAFVRSSGRARNYANCTSPIVPNAKGWRPLEPAGWSQLGFAPP